MNKPNIYACSLMLISFLSVYSPNFADNTNSTTIDINGEKMNFVLKTFEQNGNKRWEIQCNGNNCYAQPLQNSNIYAFKLFFDANKYCKNIYKNASKGNWHKNIVHYDTDSDNAMTTVETLANKDTCIELSVTNGEPIMAFLRTTNAEVSKNATGYALIGMSPDEVESILGTYQTQVENDVPSMVYSFYIDGGSMYELNLGLDDGRVSEIMISNDAPGECGQKSGERTYCDGDIPEGWYTQGTVTAVKLNVRKEPKTGEVIAKIGIEHPEMMFAETRDTGDEYKWVKILTKSDNLKNYSKPVEGWVYGKFISPSFKNFDYRNSFLNCFEYFDWLQDLLEMPDSDELGKPDENNKSISTKKWNNKGIILKSYVYESGESYMFAGELTKDNYAFAGLKVGDSLNKLKEFDKNLNKAGFILADGNNISDNTVIRWLNKESSSDDGYNHEIEIETKLGKINKISFSR